MWPKVSSKPLLLAFGSGMFTNSSSSYLKGRESNSLSRQFLLFSLFTSSPSMLSMPFARFIAASTFSTRLSPRHPSPRSYHNCPLRPHLIPQRNNLGQTRGCEGRPQAQGRSRESSSSCNSRARSQWKSPWTSGPLADTASAVVVTSFTFIVSFPVVNLAEKKGMPSSSCFAEM